MQLNNTEKLSDLINTALTDVQSIKTLLNDNTEKDKQTLKPLARVSTYLILIMISLSQRFGIIIIIIIITLVHVIIIIIINVTGISRQALFTSRYHIRLLSLSTFTASESLKTKVKTTRLTELIIKAY